jgi:methionine--tRNA ligase beta chain
MKDKITIEMFRKLDIRIGEITAVSPIPESQRLLKIIFDFGNEERQVIAGMASFFDNLELLLHLKMPVLMNIQPAIFMGYESQAMILAADVDGKPVFLEPTEDIPVGSVVK